MEARLRSTGRPSLVVHTTLPQDGGPLQGAGPGGRPPRKALPPRGRETLRPKLGTGLNPVRKEARGSRQNGVVRGFMDRDPLQRDGTVFGPSSDGGGIG